MSSNGGCRRIFQALGFAHQAGEQCAVPQQPTALSTTVGFFTNVPKIAEGTAATLEKWGKAASEAVFEVSETLRVIDELVEYYEARSEGQTLRTGSGLS